MRFVFPALLATLFAALWWFNPSSDQFSDFIAREIQTIAADAGETAADEAGGAMGFLTARLGRAAGDAAGRVAGREAGKLFERENYIVASTYSLDLNGRPEGGEWVFLGIGGQFFPIKQPEKLSVLIRDQLAR